MNNEKLSGSEPLVGSTRRSFIKRSVVAAVAVSSMTIFSGLVDAGETGGSGSKCEGEGYVCTWTGGPKEYNVSQGSCKGANGREKCTCTWRKARPGRVGGWWECN